MHYAKVSSVLHSARISHEIKAHLILVKEAQFVPDAYNAKAHYGIVALYKQVNSYLNKHFSVAIL